MPMLRFECAVTACITALWCHSFPTQAMELFQRAADTTSRERDLCRAVPEPEAVITLVGTVKIQAAGTQKLKQAMQQQKKKK